MNATIERIGSIGISHSTGILMVKVAVSVGQTVGDYRVIGIIGAGGMGTVYKVQHLISDRIEAMKVVLPSLTASGELADRFIERSSCRHA